MYCKSPAVDVMKKFRLRCEQEREQGRASEVTKSVRVGEMTQVYSGSVDRGQRAAGNDDVELERGWRESVRHERAVRWWDFFEDRKRMKASDVSDQNRRRDNDTLKPRCR